MPQYGHGAKSEPRNQSPSTNPRQHPHNPRRQSNVSPHEDFKGHPKLLTTAIARQNGNRSSWSNVSLLVAMIPVTQVDPSNSEVYAKCLSEITKRCQQGCSENNRCSVQNSQYVYPCFQCNAASSDVNSDLCYIQYRCKCSINRWELRH